MNSQDKVQKSFQKKRSKNSQSKNGISWQNKDITSKVFADSFPMAQLDVYGVHLPKILSIEPTNLPAVSANELRIDNIFRLADNSLAILDYESTYSEANKTKYLDYIARILKRYQDGTDTKELKIRMIVLYTADVKPEDTNNILNIGAVQLQIEQAFLSRLNSEEIRTRLTAKIHGSQILTDKERLEFIILPLTYVGLKKKKEIIKELFELAKDIEDEKTQSFLLSGVIVFSDKVIDKETANQIKEWIMMTKVDKLFAQERQKAVMENTKAVASANALAFLKEGISIEKVARCISALTLDEIKALAKTIQ
ncbi:MAG: hypothetical protein PHR92_17725 [Lachnospiraceae bacterium]|nr:hypothetical protein [Lachnospiraceae bacterium]